MKELRITNFFLVPRIIQKIVEGIMSKVDASSKIKQMLFNKAYQARLQYYKALQKEYNLTWWDIYHGKKTIEDLKYESKPSDPNPKADLKRFDFPAWTNIVFN